MIVLRRALAVLLTAALALVFGACLVATRTADALDPAFLKEEVERVDAYDFLHEVLLPLTLEEALAEQSDWLPDNFAAVELPAEADAPRVLLRDVFPPEYLREQAEQAIDALVPYLAGRSDAFELRFALADRVDAALAHAPGEPSPVERAFRDLDLGRVLLDGAFATFEEQALAAAAEAGVERSVAASELARFVPDRDAAAQWFTGELSRAMDALHPYLAGDADSFAVEVRFDDQPGLAAVLAEMLQRDPAVLAGEGFAYSDRDLNTALGGGDPAAREERDRRLDTLRRDFVYTHGDFAEDITGDGGSARLDGARRWTNRLRGALPWAGVAPAAALLLAIGALGGRRWPTRALWAAGALLAVSAGWYALFGPLYGQYAEPALHDRLVEATAGWSQRLDAVRPHVIEKTETVAGDFVGGMASRARLWLAASAAAFAAAALWAYRSPPAADRPERWSLPPRPGG